MGMFITLTVIGLFIVAVVYLDLVGKAVDYILDKEEQ